MEKLTSWQFVSGFDKSAKSEEPTNIVMSDVEIAVCNDDLTVNPKCLPFTLVLKNGVIYKKRDFAKIITFPQFEEGSEEQMYRDLTLFKPHKRDEFKNLTYQEVLALYKSCDVYPNIDGQGNIMTKERAK